MRPSFSINHFKNRVSADAEFGGNTVDFFSTGKKTSNSNNLFCGQLGIPSTLSARKSFRMGSGAVAVACCRAVTILLHLIGGVVLSCTQPKMVRTNAGRIVAFMQAVKIWGNVSNIGYIGKPVRPDVLLRSIFRHMKRTVSVLVSAGLPNPATSKFFSVFRNGSVFIHLNPKPFGENRMELDNVRNYCNRLFSSLHRSILCGLSAISRATYTGDGAFFYGPSGLISQG